MMNRVFFVEISPNLDYILAGLDKTEMKILRSMLFQYIWWVSNATGYR